jgi:Zn-dependent M28 family amino/carboxypeptidase
MNMNLYSKNFNGEEETENFIAETREGDINNTIVVGAHADGVEEGPGLNDNGNT